jgi:hypothetical protein
MAERGEFLDEALDDLDAEFLVSHFAAAKPEGGFDLHVIAEKIDGMTEFHAEVMGIDGGGELDFFDAVGVLMFFGFFVAFGLFVAVFAVVDEATNWRGGAGGDFDEVDTVSAGEADGFAEWQDAELMAVDSDYTDFAGADFPIDSGERTAGVRRTGVGALQDTPIGWKLFMHRLTGASE